MTEVTRIMVVDDHIHLAENIAEILEGEGYQTLVAGSAEQALETLSHDLVHALITDYKLPGLNGAQLIGELRRRGQGIPALVMSAYSDDDTVQLAKHAGAMAVVGKPVAIAQLLRLVASMRESHA